MYRIDISKIVYFEAEGNYTNIVLANKIKATICLGIGKMLEILKLNLSTDSSVFIRIGKSHIINADYVYSIAIVKQRLTLSDGSSFSYTLAVSKEALKSLREMYIKSNI